MESHGSSRLARISEALRCTRSFELVDEFVGVRRLESGQGVSVIAGGDSPKPVQVQPSFEAGAQAHYTIEEARTAATSGEQVDHDGDDRQVDRDYVLQPVSRQP